MKIFINNKEFNFKFIKNKKRNGEIKVFIEDKEDIIYFKNWFYESINNGDKRIVFFETVTETGELQGCYPIAIHFDGNDVTLAYELLILK